MLRLHYAVLASLLCIGACDEPAEDELSKRVLKKLDEEKEAEQEAPASAAAASASAEDPANFPAFEEVEPKRPPTYQIADLKLEQLKRMVTGLGWKSDSTFERPRKPGKDWKLGVNIHGDGSEGMVSTYCRTDRAPDYTGGPSGGVYFVQGKCEMTSTVRRKGAPHFDPKASAELLEAVLASDP